MELGDFIPKEVTHEFSQGLIVTLKPMSIGDEAWMRNKFGEKELEKALSNLNMEVIAKIFYHQMTMESKKDLLDIKFIDIDEDGEEIEVFKKPLDKLYALIEGPQQGYDILNKIFESKGTSLKQLEELVGDKDLKKFLQKKSRTG